jgi:hypothetical protein
MEAWIHENSRVNLFYNNDEQGQNRPRWQHNNLEHSPAAAYAAIGCICSPIGLGAGGCKLLSLSDTAFVDSFGG